MLNRRKDVEAAGEGERQGGLEAGIQGHGLPLDPAGELAPVDRLGEPSEDPDRAVAPAAEGLAIFEAEEPGEELGSRPMPL